MSNLLHVVEIVSSEVDVPLLSELFAGEEIAVSSYTSKETGIGSTYIVCADAADCAAQLERVKQLLPLWQDLCQGDELTASSITMKEEDWSQSWKKYFHTFRASRQLVIKPSWEDYTPEPGDIVLVLDPGMCFGTGYHGTTRACLQYLDELRDAFTGKMPVSFLDAGCGSGILSLGARKLGYGPVCAFDFDPVCVTTTRENLAGEGVTDVEIWEGDVTKFTPPRKFQVVAANILAVILQKAAENLVSFVDHEKQDGFLILSGILTEQYPAVRQRFTALGLQEMDCRTIKEWTSGCFLLPAEQAEGAHGRPQAVHA